MALVSFQRSLGPLEPLPLVIPPASRRAHLPRPLSDAHHGVALALQHPLDVRQQPALAAQLEAHFRDQAGVHHAGGQRCLRVGHVVGVGAGPRAGRRMHGSRAVSCGPSKPPRRHAAAEPGISRAQPLRPHLHCNEPRLAAHELDDADAAIRARRLNLRAIKKHQHTRPGGLCAGRKG